MSMTSKGTTSGYKHRIHRSKAGKKRWRNNKGIRIYLEQKMARRNKDIKKRSIRDE